jgi:hypothetical protein
LASIYLTNDDNNSILIELAIDYNRWDARKDSVLDTDELKQKIMHEYDDKGILVVDANESLFIVPVSLLAVDY